MPVNQQSSRKVATLETGYWQFMSPSITTEKETLASLLGTQPSGDCAEPKYFGVRRFIADLGATLRPARWLASVSLFQKAAMNRRTPKRSRDRVWPKNPILMLECPNSGEFGYERLSAP